MAALLRDLVQRARIGNLRSREISEATFTVDGAAAARFLGALKERLEAPGDWDE